MVYKKRVVEYLTESLICSKCGNEVRYIANDKFARCPRCSHYLPRDKLSVDVTGSTYLESVRGESSNGV